MAEFGFVRLVDEASGKLHVRPPAVRDADRLLYNSHFRRLGGVTQVLPPDHTLAHHDRLTHSIKVAQLARRIAFFFRNRAHAQVDVDAAYAGGLAHDIGHPPFGHHGESVFQKWCEEQRFNESFEGNAQSLRILTKNAIDGSAGPWRAGLNWSWRSIAATVKYPRLRHEGGRTHSKWGAYDSEADLLAVLRERVLDRGARSGLCVEAQIMDFADDVTYAIHDVEDFYRAGLVPLHDRDRWHDMCAEPDVKERVRSAYIESGFADDKFEGHYSNSKDDLDTLLPEHHDPHAAAATTSLQSFADGSIAQFISGIALDEAGDLVVAPTTRVQIELLKNLTRYFVWEHNHEIRQLQERQRVLLSQLLDRLSNQVEAVFNNWRPPTTSTSDVSGWMPHEVGSTSLPPMLEYFVVEAMFEEQSVQRDRRGSHLRAVMDFLCSQTDAQVVTRAIAEGIISPDRRSEHLYIPFVVR